MSFNHNKNKSDQRIAPNNNNNNHGLPISSFYIGSSRSISNINNIDPNSSFPNKNSNIYSGDFTLDNNNNNKNINRTENTNLVNSIPPSTLPHTLDLLTKASPHNPRFSFLRSSPFQNETVTLFMPGACLVAFRQLSPWTDRMMTATPAL